jgi:cell shape-determining protein MreD
MRNLIAFPLLGLAVILQSAVVSRIELLAGYADLVLIILAAWALQTQVESAWHWAALASLLVAFVSRLPWPVVLLGYLGVVFFAQVLQKRVWQAPLLAMFSVIFLGTLFMHLAAFVVLSLTGASLPVEDVVGLITLPSLLLNLVLAVPIYTLMRDLAVWVYPGQEPA